MALPTTLVDVEESIQRDTPLQSIWTFVTSNVKVTIGTIIVGFFFGVAIFGPFFIHDDPGLYTHHINLLPSLQHLLGTTTGGQDIFEQLVLGTRASLFWGLGTTLVIEGLGTVVGIAGAYFGGWIDEIMSLVSNVFLTIPGLVLAIVLAAFMPRGSFTVAIAITVTSWAYAARSLRAQTLSIRNRDYITAANSMGERTWRILFFEILPNELPILSAGIVNNFSGVIVQMATLEFLGLGSLNNVSWGTMLYWAQVDSALIVGQWWWFVPPGLCIALFGAGLVLLNFGIDEIADPRLHVSRPRKRAKLKKAVA